MLFPNDKTNDYNMLKTFNPKRIKNVTKNLIILVHTFEKLNPPSLRFLPQKSGKKCRLLKIALTVSFMGFASFIYASLIFIVKCRRE